jgi:hypothetical protein
LAAEETAAAAAKVVGVKVRAEAAPEEAEKEAAGGCTATANLLVSTQRRVQ